MQPSASASAVGHLECALVDFAELVALVARPLEHPAHLQPSDQDLVVGHHPRLLALQAQTVVGQVDVKLLLEIWVPKPLCCR